MDLQAILEKLFPGERVATFVKMYEQESAWHGKFIVHFTRNATSAIARFDDILGTKETPRHYEFLGVIDERPNTGSGEWRRVMRDWVKSVRQQNV